MSKQTSCMTDAVPDATDLRENRTSLPSTLSPLFGRRRFTAPLDYGVTLSLKAAQLFTQGGELLVEHLNTLGIHDSNSVQRRVQPRRADSDKKRPRRRPGVGWHDGLCMVHPIRSDQLPGPDS